MTPPIQERSPIGCEVIRHQDGRRRAHDVWRSLYSHEAIFYLRNSPYQSTACKTISVRSPGSHQPFHFSGSRHDTQCTLKKPDNDVRPVHRNRPANPDMSKLISALQELVECYGWSNMRNRASFFLRPHLGHRDANH